ncbi:(deoxy)nucleoside triphosphate pyrophosphohydrolase [Microbacterium yannicii]|uniref:8-oxo-dGTP diphosphatase n=1 Tax=Microbacterium yannicii TaxID=671622 RepID=A0ABP9M916_9MICO
MVGAVIMRNGTVLCARRGPSGSLPGHWEFPGGKIERDETAKAALEREIAEELECTVDVGNELTTTVHKYDFGVVTLTTFWCELLEGSPRLTEHAEVRWCSPSELEGLDWAPADIPAMRMIVAAADSGQLGQN